MNRILHTINKSPFSSTLLKQCMDRYNEGDSIVLLEDGVYSALKSHLYAQAFAHIPHCYAIEADVVARGLSKESLLKHITLIDYKQFVALSVEHPLQQSWY